MDESKKVSAFVHLAYGFGAERWNARWKSGALIGVNEPFAYGYHRAQAFNCTVNYSLDHREGRIGKAARQGLRLLLGFDFIHAWRNRQAIFSSDVVWTHTESQSLAVAALIMLIGRSNPPKTILQSVWLMDKWHRLNAIQKIVYKILFSKADVLSFHSAMNADKARKIFIGKQVERVFFGINADRMITPVPAKAHQPTRVLSIGNDPHRDWATLRAALMGRGAYELRVVTTRLPKGYLNDNASVMRVKTNEELFELYRWADVVIVPLKPNLHASGITVIQEATTQGLPVICTDTGGLRDYFPDGEVRYVQVGAPDALRQAVDDLAADAHLRAEMVRLAQLRMTDGELNSQSFARIHVEISRSLA